MVGSLVLFSFFLTSTNCQSDDVTALVYSLQEKYCGTMFCEKTGRDQPQVCPIDLTIELTPEVDMNTTSAANESEEVERLTNRKCDACVPCSCDDDCDVYGTCCADKHVGGKFYFNCEMEMVYRSKEQILQSEVFFTVTKCPRDAPNYNLTLVDRCENRMSKIQDGGVVMFTNTNRTHLFRNKYCAECYNITDYTSPVVYLGCKERSIDIYNYTDLNAMVASLTEHNNCMLGYDLPITPITTCTGVETIDTCNITGKWQDYNETIEEACHSSFNPIVFSYYRNIFCYMCNGEPLEQLECPSHCYPLILSLMFGLEFLARLDYDKSDFEIQKGGEAMYKIQRVGRQTSRQCREGDIFDDQSKKCRELYCPFASKNDTASCIKLVPNQQLVRTIWEVTGYIKKEVILKSLHNIPFSIGKQILKNMDSILESYGFAMALGTAYDYATTRPPLTLVLSESHVRFELFLMQGNDLVTARTRLSKERDLVLNGTLGGEPAEILIVPHSGPRNTKMKVMTYPAAQARLLPGMLTPHGAIQYVIPLKFNVSCPMVRYHYQDIEMTGSSGIIHGHRVLDEAEYTRVVEREHNSDYFVCLEASMEEKQMGIEKDRDEEKEDGQGGQATPGVIISNNSPRLCLGHIVMVACFYAMLQG